MNKKPFFFEVRLRLKSVNSKKIHFLKEELKLLASEYGLYYSSISLPVNKSNITVLKSPHVNKKAKDQFEICVNNCLVILKGLTQNSSLFLRLKEFESEEVVTRLIVSLNLKNV